MINFAKHDEEFHGIFKLVSGEEILAKAVLTDDDGETLCFISDPVMIQTITKEILQIIEKFSNGRTRDFRWT